MMRIMIPVTSPPRYAPMNAAVFDVSGSLPSGGSGVDVGLVSGVDVGVGSGVDVGLVSDVDVGLGSGVDVGLGSRSDVQEGYMQ